MKGALIEVLNDKHGPHHCSLKEPYPFRFIAPTFMNPFTNMQTPYAAPLTWHSLSGL